MSDFKPYISSAQSPRELTWKSIFLGLIFGIIFGASTVYLGLKIGMTVSASIPIAVLSIAIFKKFGRSTILENNIVQTTGSAGESIASGVTFTLPALIFLGFELEYPLIVTLTLIGGVMGVLFMIPLRRYLIVKEHGKLPYPEGTACADVLIAGEKGGKLAKLVFSGLGFAGAYKLLMSIGGFWKDTPFFTLPWFRNAVVAAEITPELLGVGYIIGPRIASYTAAGGALAWLVLMPAISFFGQTLSAPIAPATKLISEMSMMEIWANYIRYIGGGTVVFGGLVTLVRSFPTIWNSFAKGFKDFQAAKMLKTTAERTDRDIPIMVTVFGSLFLIVVIGFLPFMPGTTLSHFIAALLVVVLGFFFSTVSSRITGLIGSSSNPISGMTITTLMITCLIFVLCGWKGKEFAAVALSVGTLVCIAAANAGNTSQDLKTGFLVGATPFKQQLSLIVGVVLSSLIIGATMISLHKSGLSHGGGIGSAELPAPKGQLMAIIIEGVLSQNLPWELIFLGVFIGFVIYLCGVEPLPFAVGVYLPFSISLPILIGGLVHLFVKSRGEKSGDGEETSPGVLYSSGLIAGGAIMGIVYAFMMGWWPRTLEMLNLGTKWGLGEAQGAVGNVIAVGVFLFMAGVLYRTARGKN